MTGHPIPAPHGSLPVETSETARDRFAADVDRKEPQT
jgi:hypothetical protein